ncbi:MAG: glycosyltransferase family 39 protein [Microgenomates group bacterium]
METQFTASLWGDEAWAATLAVKPLWQIIKIVSHDTSPPLYYLFLHLWMKIFGTSELAIRSLSFLFFLLTVIVVYHLASFLWNKKTAFLASLLVFANPFLFNYAFEGRMYALLALTSTASIYFFLRNFRWPFILTTTAALYTHHFSLLVVFWEIIWRFFQKKPFSLKKFLAVYSDFFLIALFYLPWLYPLYYQTSLVASGFWLGKPTLNTLLETIKKFLVGSQENNFQKTALFSFLLVFLLRDWKKNFSLALFFLGWFFTPLLVTFILSQFFQSIFFDRYMLMAIPASSLILSSQTKKISSLFLVLGITCLLVNNYYYFFHPQKRPFRQLAEYIKTEAPQLTLVNHNAAAHHLWESKYYGLKAPIFAPQPLPFYTGTALMTSQDIIQSLPEDKEIGVISSAPLEEIKIPGYHQIKVKQFGDLKFVWFQKD